MSQLATLYKKYSPEGFHIVALESQGSTETEITSLAKTKGCGYQMTAGGSVAGFSTKGIPHGLLFGPDGKLVADNPHGTLEKLIKEQLKEVNGYMAGPGPYTKLAPFYAQVKAGVGIGTVLKTVEGKKTSKDAAEASEATMMADALTASANSLIEKAEKEKDKDPASAMTKLDKVAIMFMGSEPGTKAKTAGDNMRKDPKVKKEIEASTMLASIAKMEDTLKPVKNQRDPKSDDFRRANAAGIGQIVGGCQAVIQRYPDTIAAKKADEMMNQYK